MCWLIAIVVLCVLAFLVWASADIGSGIYLKSYCHKPTSEKILALTFDDGPDEEMTPKVLAILKQYNIKATFFMIGSKAAQLPHIVREIVAEGHSIGSHTYSHKGVFPISGAKKVEIELCKCSSVIADIAGEQPKLFRPPFGVTNPIIGRVVRKLGLNSIGWSIRSLDTVSRRSRENVCNGIIKRLHSGAIILLHDRCNDADILLQMLIPQIIEKGYRFTTIDNLILKD